jgi:hypothetical protein
MRRTGEVFFGLGIGTIVIAQFGLIDVHMRSIGVALGYPPPLWHYQLPGGLLLALFGWRLICQASGESSPASVAPTATTSPVPEDLPSE